LARALAATDHVDDAAAELERVVQDATGVFGPSAVMVGYARLSLSAIQLDTGAVPEAIAEARRAYEVVRPELKPASTAEGPFRTAEGLALLGARRAREALPLLTGVATVYEASYGAAHEKTWAVRVGEAWARGLDGALEDAERRLTNLAAKAPSGFP